MRQEESEKAMLRGMDDMIGYHVIGTDGEIGSISDFYFDDQKWAVRFLVVDTGDWTTAKSVLISPMSFERADFDDKKVYLRLTREMIQNSPDISTELPISRQMEREHYDYYDYPYYWAGPATWGAFAYPFAAVPVVYPAVDDGARPTEMVDREQEELDLHLRSFKEVKGYSIMGSDDGIGNVDDFIVDDHSWEIRWMVVDTSPWWFGGNVLISTHSINSIVWEKKTVHVGLTRNQIKNSPDWDRDKPIDREYDHRLMEYYTGRSKAV